MRLRGVWAYGLGLALTVSVAACGGGNGSAPAETAAPAAAPAANSPVDPATAADVKGTVTVEGSLPANEQIKMNADPVCARQVDGPQTMETYVLGPDGKTLGNVFVYVKDGLGDLVFEAPTTPAQIDQKDCRYHPHVFGIQVGQPLEIVNSDPTLHNIHAVAKNNREFNNGQPIQGMKTTHTFTSPEVMVPFKCDVHGWMNAYVGVMTHPFYAVTDASGAFTLKGLPAGTYTIEAWHEKLGAQTQTVTVAAKETKDVSFTFKPAASTN
ncbi:MAG: carboxypeptidase regulatory-like domain-containing protein [Vicinamibacterales bacterium]